MKNAFFIVDCSGSIAAEATMLQKINALLHDVIEEYEQACDDIYIVVYGNNAKIYWQKSSNESFVDIPADKCGGRSSLGKAYSLIAGEIDKKGFALSDCALVLISDGEATDNFKRRLGELDPKREAYRVAISFGTNSYATERHAFDDRLAFKNANRDRDDFFDALDDFIS